LFITSIRDTAAKL